MKETSIHFLSQIAILLLDSHSPSVLSPAFDDQTLRERSYFYPKVLLNYYHESTWVRCCNDSFFKAFKEDRIETPYPVCEGSMTVTASLRQCQDEQS